MSLQSIKTSAVAAAWVLIALTVAQPASAQQLQSNLGPVDAYEPILATFGDKRVLAYFEPDGDNCAVSAIVFDVASGDDRTSTRVRISLKPGELLHLDSIAEQNVILTCGPNADKLVVLNRGELLTRAARVN